MWTILLVFVNRKLAGRGKEVVRKMKVCKPSVNRGLAAHHIHTEAAVLFTGNAADISLAPFDRWGNRGSFCIEGIYTIQRQKVK